MGEWLWTTRTGAEIDLIEELALQGIVARRLAPALVAAAGPARREPAFARQGFQVLALLPAAAERATAALLPRLKRTTAVHVFVPDSDAGNRASQQAQALAEGIAAQLQAAGVELVRDGIAAKEAGGFLAQGCLLPGDRLAVGVVRAVEAHSLAPGGRLRFHVSDHAPARSAMKLGEALAWLERGPEPGEVCVDLGAAPGGWTYVLSERRAHVVAVDPARLSPTVTRRHGVEHLQMSAFSFEPEIAADWLLCDMAWRPLEVAALLAKWGRRHWARFLLANIKLPMKKRAEMVQRVLDILATGGWTGLRVRQLYHDRDEVTVSAWRGFGADARPPKKRAARLPEGTGRV